MNLSTRKFTVIVLFTFFSFSAYAQYESRVFYWVADKTGATDDYLLRYANDRKDSCRHYLARVNGIAFQRQAAVALRSGNPNYQHLVDYYARGNELVMAMNSSLMNKSWIFANPEQWKSKWQTDVSLINKAKAVGATKVIMFMQSVLSKGNGLDYDSVQGATLDKRVDDCIIYADYVWSKKPDGIEVTFGLIDAYPAKTPRPGDEFHAAYVNLAKKLMAKGYVFEEIQFDMKTITPTNSGGANKLLTAMKRAYTEIKAETGAEVRMTWYTWWGTAAADFTKVNNKLKLALNNIKNHPDGHYMTGLHLDGNKENRYGVPDLIPTLASQQRTLTARLNEAYCILEGAPAMNPVAASDTIWYPLHLNNINTTKAESTVSIYPNPAKNYFTVEGLKGKTNIEIYNSQGKLIEQHTVLEKNTIINTETYNKGLYIIRFSDNARILKLVVE